MEIKKPRKNSRRDRQIKVLEFIFKHQRKSDTMPTHAQIAEHIGTSTHQIENTFYIMKMEGILSKTKKGYNFNMKKINTLYD